MIIEEKTVQVGREVVVKKAHYKEDVGGKTYVEPVRSIQIKDVQMFVVNDGVDIHEFANEEDAKLFIKGG